MPRRVLVMGFGPFQSVTDNPAERLARQIDGIACGGVTFVGRVMPVSFTRAVATTQRLIGEFSPSLLVGVGVATSRQVITVEMCGHNVGCGTTPDVDGQRRSIIDPEGPDKVMVSLPPQPLASLLGAVVGDDAGRYVCNAWIYQMLRAVSPDLPVGFIHIPPAGLPATRLANALAKIEDSPDGTHTEVHR